MLLVGLGAVSTTFIAGVEAVKKAATKFDLAEQVIEDIRQFQRERNISKLVMVACPHEWYQLLC